MTRLSRTAATGFWFALASFGMTVSSIIGLFLIAADGPIARAYLALANWPCILFFRGDFTDFSAHNQVLLTNMVGWGSIGLILGALWPRSD
jgi:hypothetical protein